VPVSSGYFQALGLVVLPAIAAAGLNRRLIG